MKRLLYLSLIIAVMVICSNTAMAWDLPLAIDVLKIYFNHNTGSAASDGLTIQEDETTITAPEWYPASSKNEESAFLKSVTTPTVKAEFYANDIGQQGYSGVTIFADKTGGDGLWELSEANMTFPGGGSGQVSFSTNASYPQSNTVGKWTFTWEWYVTKIDGGSVTPFSIGQSTHTYYNTYSIPVSPMDTTWVEVLDYSCVWAQGEDSVVDAATDVATGIYNMQDYSGNIEFLKITDYTDEYGFHLSTFLSHLQTENVFVNCYDCSNLFCIFSNALGCSTQTKLGLGDIYTYPIYLIGNNTPPLSEEFGSQQFGWISDFFVYDSCLTIYPNILPYNMYYITYDSALIQTGSLSYQNPETTVIAN